MYARAVYDATAAIQETPSLMRAYVIKAESLISLGLRHAGECRKNRAKFLNLPTNWIMCILLVQMIIFDQTNDHRVLAPTRTPTLAPTAKLTCNDALEALAAQPCRQSHCRLPRVFFKKSCVYAFEEIVLDSELR